ncbi:hypothetical protein EV2_000393 [Malus domestica]
MPEQVRKQWSFSNGGHGHEVWMENMTMEKKMAVEMARRGVVEWREIGPGLYFLLGVLRNSVLSRALNSTCWAWAFDAIARMQT